MKLNIRKFQKGGSSKLPTFSLPEINIYPNNKWGDIARKQGLETARNWRKVREGTTAGINNFGNKISEGLQFAPVAGDIIDAKDLYKSFKDRNYSGVALASLGFIPFLGDAAQSFIKTSKKLQKIGDIKDLSKLSDEEWDILYDRAVKENNLEEVQKIRDLHFKTKAPNTKTSGIYYRHDDQNFNVFDSSKFGTFGERIGKGIYFFSDKDAVKNYGSNIKSFYVNSSNLAKDIEGPKLFGKDILINKFINSKIPTLKKAAENVKNADAVYGVDTSWGKPLDEYVVKNSNQVKLSNPITYDDTGKIIPISKRDNFLNPDIRYSIIPLSLLGLWNTQNNDN